MRFSVIVPVYNLGILVNQCVISLISQTFDNFEIILVNDGSTDNSLSILREWEKKDKRIQIIDKLNGGLSSARNVGLRQSIGDYILFVDGDDWLAIDALESIEDYLRQNENVDMLCFDYYAYYDDNHMKLISFKAPMEIVDGLTYFERSSFKITAWSKVYRKSFLDKIDLNFLEGRLHEDLSYTIPLCLCANCVGYVNKPLYYYRQNREGSIMRKISYKNVLDFSHALCFDYYLLKQRGRLNVYVSQWIKQGFYKACFTAEVNLSTILRCFKENNVAQVCAELGDKNSFLIKVLFWHYFLKIKKSLGNIKHLIRK